MTRHKTFHSAYRTPGVPSIVTLQGGAAFLLWLVVMLAFLAAVAWTYLDAKQHSEHPAFLWAIVVFLAPLLGLVLYVLLGRDSGGRRKASY